MLKIGLIVSIILAILAGSGVGIGLHLRKGKEKEEAIQEEFNLGFPIKHCVKDLCLAKTLLSLN